jgi:RNA polymerase sigma factor (TIGR02999 family)
MAYASRAMRSLLVDMARERLAQKRFADLIPLTLSVAAPDLAGTPEQLLALDDALARLGAAEPRLMQVAELRVVMGMQVHEIADALGVSEPTVKRDWQRARAFLHDALGVAP